MRTPVVLVTGVDPDPMAGAVVALQFDLPSAVVVHHRLDPDRQTLERVVSDVDGVVEREVLHLEHACVSCAIREDVVPTLERLAAAGRWASILAHLPVGAPADQVARVVAHDPRLARRLRVASVLAALDGATAVDDLIGSDLLCERGRHSGPDDRRGVGEVACAMVEYADVVMLADPLSDPLSDRTAGSGAQAATVQALVRTLARPDAALVKGVAGLDGTVLGGGPAGWLHDPHRTRAWADEVRTDPIDPPTSPLVWQLDLRSPRPFDADRLLDGLEALGGGRHRSRGHFWVPSRPGHALAWDGAGGQLSIGTSQPWGRRRPETRIVLVGVGAAPARLAPAFEGLLGPTGPTSPVGHDGLEPWLGPIRGVA